MTTLITGTYISTANLNLGGTFAIQPAGPLGTCIEVRLPWRDENG